VGEARINRHDFQVSWKGQLHSGGVVVSDEVFIKVNVEALPADGDGAVSLSRKSANP
jgi:hypothetical protein